MRSRGFTILELIFAMVIIAILTAMGSATLQRAKSSAYLAVMESDLRSLTHAQEVYHASTGGYFADDPNQDASATYASQTHRLDFTPSPNVMIKMRADERGWSARAEHKLRRPDRFYCAIFIGEIDPYEPAQTEGVIACEPKTKKDM